MKKNLFYLASCLSMCALHTLPIMAQDVSSPATQEVFRQTKTQYLRELATEKKQAYSQNKQKAEAHARKNGMPLVIKSANGQIAYVDGITENGHLLYIGSDNNTDAAATTGANRLQTGGNLGLALSGKGMKVGVWEVGTPSFGHIEFNGKVTQADAGDAALSDHATHVNGTMVGIGLNPLARGMAFDATSDSYTSNNDSAEMATAGGNGLLISNHSYGLLSGWFGNSWYGDQSVSNQEDYKFGFYSGKCRDWDNVAINAPFYLIFKSAGNSRGGTGVGRPANCNAGTGYDCVSDAGNAKNIMTVAAVQAVLNYTSPASVVMSSFSSWGPTDDGRIKPDISADGVNVLSAINTTANPTSAYGALSGTSMASPNSAGSMLLVQELNQKLYGNYLRSSTLKGLAIHTAKEAGTDPGPDYRFGWGLLDVAACANILLKKNTTSQIVEENTLNNGGNFQKVIAVTTGQKVTATICWLDPAGTPVTNSLDPINPMLVNDLDMRITGNSTTFSPWILGGATNPDAAATTGDNVLDNVEKIEFTPTTSGNYTLNITHKGSLSGGSQRFSLIITTEPFNVFRNAFYWVGGAGNWNNGNEWSDRSGGTPINQVPTINDVVIFDANSFSAVGQTVQITPNASCYSFTWLSDKNANFQFGGNNLTVDGNFFRRATTLAFSDAGTVRFTGTSSKLNNIDIEEPNFPNATFLIDAPTATEKWTLQNPINASGITIAGGTFGLNPNVSTLSLSDLTANTSKAKNIAMPNLNIDGLSNVNIGSTGLSNFNITNTNLKFSAAGNKTLTGTGVGFSQVESTNGKLTVSGANNVFTNVKATGELEFLNSNSMQQLTMVAGSTLRLANGTTQTVAQNTDFQSTSANPVTITSAGTATLSFANARRYCYNFLNITNVNKTGTPIVAIGANSTLTNGMGWINNSCANLLFSDFSVKFPCANSITEFTDRSTGNVTSRLWNFDVASGNTNTSTQTNPTFTYTTAGSYQVRLNVGDGTSNETSTQNITVVNPPAGLSQPTITVTGGTLRSSITNNAFSYQWLLNGTPIAGATSSQYNVTQAGNYQVIVFNNDCKFTSATTAVTALPEDQIKLASTLTLYPNPTHQTLKVGMENTLYGGVKTEICDVTGKIILVSNAQKNDTLFTDEILLENIPTGVYVVKVYINGVSTSQRIVKK